MMAQETNIRLTAPLRSGAQCDEDGVMNIVIRQACHEAADLIEEMYGALEQHEAFLERLIAMVSGGSDISDANFATSMNALLEMTDAALSKARGEN